MLDIYQRVTDRIVAAIEAGADKYRMPWHEVAERGLPHNLVTKRAYRGVNTLALWAEQQGAGYTSATWATYKQWAEVGAQVRKGESATHIVYWGTHERPTDDGDTETRLFARGYCVFNACQVDGYDAPAIVLPPEPDRDATVDAWVEALGVTIKHGGNKAYFSPSTDHVQMPHLAQFHFAVGYYSVLMHELTHWTGTDARCARTFGKRFGDEAYAMEELVAELGAAFLCGTLGITPEPRPDHAAYIASWLKRLKEDKRAIFTAASAAQKAADWLHAQQPQPQQQQAAA